MSNLSQFSLRWNNYVQHVTDAFESLRTHDDLVDVTLCCEGRKIKAHKVLLSACSAYFKEIFKENPCRHPVIIFRNVKFDDLNGIIHFMYHGEVNILHEQLESFLITAELLEVNGLTDGTEDDDKISNRFENWATPQPTSFDTNTPKQKIYDDSNIELLNEEPINLATTQLSKLGERAPFPSTTTTAEFSQSSIRYDVKTNLEDRINAAESIARSSVTVTQISDEMQIDQGNEDLTDRSISNESELAKFKCELCPKGFKHPTSLTLHRDSHTGKTQCPVCHRSFSRSYDMRSHLQKIHQGKNLTIKEIRYKVGNDNIAPKTFTHHI